MSKRKFNAVAASSNDENPRDWLFKNMPLVIDWLKTKYFKDGMKSSKSLDDIVGYISVPTGYDKTIVNLAGALKMNSRVEVIPKGAEKNKVTLYRYKTKLPIHNAESLLNFFAQPEAPLHVEYKDLQDGWPGCESELLMLEIDHKILIYRHEKKGTILTIHPDNINLYIDSTDDGKASADFYSFWRAVKLPNEKELQETLQEAEITATSSQTTKRAFDDKFFVKPQGRKRPGTKRPQRFDTKKATNAALFKSGMLKDYSKK
ncbi:Transcription initiation factor IIE subunit beta [Pseudocercospora fuligena]|uniref:Transcription initiation factor IIE subunit beta n=1 Tax=Pseudocercospora fuligena TaxID=685502 RepID=A0A8H6RGM7_9PEZI|nr:Transcription initiation factor IIE subunit beta [Pseudocercospora fuligena]